jgi:hypothetical protein
MSAPATLLERIEDIVLVPFVAASAYAKCTWLLVKVAVSRRSIGGRLLIRPFTYLVASSFLAASVVAYASTVARSISPKADNALAAILVWMASDAAVPTSTASVLSRAVVGLLSAGGSLALFVLVDRRRHLSSDAWRTIAFLTCGLQLTLLSVFVGAVATMNFLTPRALAAVTPDLLKEWFVELFSDGAFVTVIVVQIAVMTLVTCVLPISLLTRLVGTAAGRNFRALAVMVGLVSSLINSASIVLWPAVNAFVSDPFDRGTVQATLVDTSIGAKEMTFSLALRNRSTHTFALSRGASLTFAKNVVVVADVAAWSAGDAPVLLLSPGQLSWLKVSVPTASVAAELRKRDVSTLSVEFDTIDALSTVDVNLSFDCGGLMGATGVVLSDRCSAVANTPWSQGRGGVSP